MEEALSSCILHPFHPSAMTLALPYNGPLQESLLKNTHFQKIEPMYFTDHFLDAFSPIIHCSLGGKV